MDASGRLASVAAFAAADSSSSSMSPAADVDIMDDVSLSAQASSHAISLVKNASHRYLFPDPSGRPSSTLPVVLRQNRDEGDNNHDEAGGRSVVASSLVTEAVMERRAVRATALRVLHMDSTSSDNTSATPASASEVLRCSTHDAVAALSSRGYYDHALALVGGMASKRGGGRPGGKDVFSDGAAYVLCRYLVPAALGYECEEEEGAVSRRPTMAQLRMCSASCALDGNDDGGGSSNGLPIITPSSVIGTTSSARRTMAAQVLQQYTTTLADQTCGLALDVAKSVIRAEEAGGASGADLPSWLTDLCLFGLTAGTEGDDDECNEQEEKKERGDEGRTGSKGEGGLFAERRNANDDRRSGVAGAAAEEGSGSRGRQQSRRSDANQSEATKVHAAIDEAFSIAVTLHDLLLPLQSCGNEGTRAQSAVLALCEKLWHGRFEDRDNVVAQTVPVLVIRSLSATAKRTDVQRWRCW